MPEVGDRYKHMECIGEVWSTSYGTTATITITVNAPDTIVVLTPEGGSDKKVMVFGEELTFLANRVREIEEAVKKADDSE